VEQIRLNNATPLESICDALYSRNILSILIEGGSHTIQRWIDAGLWDEARVFVAPHHLTQGVRAPLITSSPLHTLESGVDALYLYAHPELPARLGIEQFSFDSV
jgi:diaminohydroxyphosphoribosylaminopyrimidine deaminase/5-amino-6-(5-phosphoribosylamino)uracil reductase